MVTVVGIILILFGFALRYWMNRRHFNRNNPFGVQEFKSYEHAVGNRFLEGIVKLIGRILMIIGVLILIVNFLVQLNNPKH